MRNKEGFNLSIIEEFYYSNIEPQALTTEIIPKLKKKRNVLCKKEEEMTAILPEKEKALFSNYVEIMCLLIMNFQVWVMPTALYQDSGSVQDLHTTHLSKTRKDENYGKYYIQTDRSTIIGYLISFFPLKNQPSISVNGGCCIKIILKNIIAFFKTCCSTKVSCISAAQR